MNEKKFPLGILAGGFMLLLLLYGCGGGNRMYSNQNGEVIRGELVLDSIPARPPEGEYVLGYGDALDVNFLYNDEFSRQDVRVRPDGRITFPYVGDIDVAGRTVSEVDSIISGKFSEILRDPEVTVIVRNFDPPVVYVIGEVELGGGYTYKEGMTLLTALAMSRGPTEEGKRSSVLVMRRIGPAHIVGIQVDTRELLDYQRFDLDIPLEPFDIVYVPKSTIKKVEDFVESATTILTSPMEVYIKGWAVANVSVQYDFYRRASEVYVR